MKTHLVTAAALAVALVPTAARADAALPAAPEPGGWEQRGLRPDRDARDCRSIPNDPDTPLFPYSSAVPDRRPAHGLTW